MNDPLRISFGNSANACDLDDLHSYDIEKNLLDMFLDNNTISFNEMFTSVFFIFITKTHLEVEIIKMAQRLEGSLR